MHQVFWYVCEHLSIRLPAFLHLCVARFSPATDYFVGNNTKTTAHCIAVVVTRRVYTQQSGCKSANCHLNANCSVHAVLDPNLAMTATPADAAKCGASNSSDDPVLSASDVELEHPSTPRGKSKDDGTLAKAAQDDATEDGGVVESKKRGCFGRRRSGDADNDVAPPPRKQFDRPVPPSWLRNPFSNIAFGWFTTLLWHVRCGTRGLCAGLCH